MLYKSKVWAQRSCCYKHVALISVVYILKPPTNFWMGISPLLWSLTSIIYMIKNKTFSGIARDIRCHMPSSRFLRRGCRPRPTLGTLGNLLKQKKELEESCGSNRKRSRSSHFPEIDSCVVKWIHDTRMRSGVLSSPLIMEKANQFANHLEIDFTANEGWLHRFKKRENLV